MRGAVSAHELYTAGNTHFTADKVHRCSADVINAPTTLDVAGMWGDGQIVAVDGSQIDTWENNLLAESHIRYGGPGYAVRVRLLHRAVQPLRAVWGVGSRLHRRWVAAQRIRRPTGYHPRGRAGPVAAGGRLPVPRDSDRAAAQLRPTDRCARHMSRAEALSSLLP